MQPSSDSRGYHGVNWRAKAFLFIRRYLLSVPFWVVTAAVILVIYLTMSPSDTSPGTINKSPLLKSRPTRPNVRDDGVNTNLRGGSKSGFRPIMDKSNASKINYSGKSGQGVSLSSNDNIELDSKKDAKSKKGNGAVIAKSAEKVPTPTVEDVLEMKPYDDKSTIVVPSVPKVVPTIQEMPETPSTSKPIVVSSVPSEKTSLVIPKVTKTLAPGEMPEPAESGSEYINFARFVLTPVVKEEDPDYSKWEVNVRALDDVRPGGCDARNSRESLSGPVGTASIIIPVHNETAAVLLTTIYSILKRTPPKMLEEIIIVDDWNDGGLGIENRPLPPKVKILRVSQREGLIRAKAYAARAAKGDVLIFLEGHCEVLNFWIQPIMNRIKEDRRRVIVPVIDIIDDVPPYDFHGVGHTVDGGFEWNLDFKWIGIPKKLLKEGRKDCDPFGMPTMSGGLFAISRRTWFEFGEYDLGMLVWGGENTEISLRTWLCGYTMEVDPCSRVGHRFRSPAVFRRFKNNFPYDFPGSNPTETAGKNKLRAATVWLDEVRKAKWYIDHGVGLRGGWQIPDVTDRLEIKKRLKCKEFSWFLENVFNPDEDK